MGVKLNLTVGSALTLAVGGTLSLTIASTLNLTIGSTLNLAGEIRLSNSCGSIHKYMHARMCKQHTHTYTHTHTHTQTCMHMLHTHTHTHMHAHANMRFQEEWWLSSLMTRQNEESKLGLHLPQLPSAHTSKSTGHLLRFWLTTQKGLVMIT